MPTDKPVVVAMGGFDGVHLGHREILLRARQLAGELRVSSAVLTLDPLPAQLIHPDFTYVLTPLEEKRALFLAMGIDTVRVIRFDADTRNQDPWEFVEKNLRPLSPRAVVVGHDHRFGKKRAGDADTLRKLLEPQNIRVEVVPEFVLSGIPVRSTTIREHLLLGHVDLAAKLLGRYYGLPGLVVSGTGTGRRLGFPTLNIQVEDREKLVPADGVYAVLADIRGHTHPGVLNIGHRPTFQGEKRSIEVHLPGLDLPSPPADVTVRFVKRLRPERKFESPSALAEQIEEDVAQARLILAEHDA